jgi:hypothetical protein
LNKLIREYNGTARRNLRPTQTYRTSAFCKAGHSDLRNSVWPSLPAPPDPNPVKLKSIVLGDQLVVEEETQIATLATAWVATVLERRVRIVKVYV